MTNRRFTWLHLTDLHVGMSIDKPLWPNVEEEVLRDLDSVAKLTGQIDAIFFTGDLTQKGASEEFTAFDGIMDTIRDRLRRLGSDPVFVAVPGNHDLVRPSEKSAVIRALQDWANDDALRSQFWSESDCDYRVAVTAAFANWTTWSANRIDWDRLSDTRRDGLLPGDLATTWEDDGLRVGILALNTAALQLREGDFEGHLSLNALQVSKLVEKLYEWVDSHDACFLLTHHDPTWLDDEGRNALFGEIAKPGRFVLHLCGHRHKQGRTLVVEGGAQARRTYVGRSLFGLDWYERRGLQRRHGYSIGSIEFGESRTMRFWPRWDVVQQGLHREIKPDQSDGIGADEGTPPEDLGSSPRVREIDARLAPTSRPSLPGWVCIDRDFLVEMGRAQDNQSLLEYFDGQDPEWPQIASGRVPLRSVAQRLIGQIRDIPRAQHWSVHRLVGPGGEGKTTIAMQVADFFGRKQDWVVLWRHLDQRGRGGRLDWRDLAPRLVAGSALLLVIDDAQNVRRQLDRFLRGEHLSKALSEKKATSVHLVLCAHTADWERAAQIEGGVEKWSKRPGAVDPLVVQGLNEDDAEELVRAYRANDALGRLAEVPEGMQARHLRQYAEDRVARGGAALLGALIQARIGHSVEVHVERILRRVVTTDSTLPLLRAYLLIAASNIAGIHWLDARVLSAAVNFAEQPFERLLQTLRTEVRTEGVGDSRRLRVRHDALARIAVQLATSAPINDPLFHSMADLYGSLAEGAAKAVPDLQNWPQVLAVAQLSSQFVGTDNDIALSIAQGAVRGAPKNDHFRSKLSQIYRETDEATGAIHAEATCRNFFSSYPEMLKQPSIRPLVCEWAVTCGEHHSLEDSAERNVWLALYSFSDQIGRQGGGGDGGLRINEPHLRKLPTISKALDLLPETAKASEEVRRGAAAVVRLARQVLPTTLHLELAAALAGPTLEKLKMNDIEPAFVQLAEFAWARTAEDFKRLLFLPRNGKLSFGAVSARISSAQRNISSGPPLGRKPRRRRTK